MKKKFSRFSKEHIEKIPDFSVLEPFDIEIKKLLKLCNLLTKIKTDEAVQAIKNYITLRSAGVIENELRACIPELIDSFEIPAERAMSKAWEHKPELVVPIDALDTFDVPEVTKGKIVLMQFDIPNANNLKAVFSGINNVNDFFLWYGDLLEIPSVMVKKRTKEGNMKEYEEGRLWKHVNNFVLARNDMIHNLTNEEQEPGELERSIGVIQGFVVTAFNLSCINIALEKHIEREWIEKALGQSKIEIAGIQNKPENYKQILDKFEEITKQHRLKN